MPATLKPVYPSQAVRAWYARRLQQLARAMAVEMLEVLKKFDPTAPSVDEPVTVPSSPEGARLATVGAAFDEAPEVALRRAFAEWGVRWEERFDRMAADMAKLFVRRSRRYVDAAFKRRLRDAGFTVRFAPSAGMVTAHQAMVADNVALIRSIPRQFHRGVEKLVATAVMKGGAQRELSKGLRQRYGVTYRRAAIISRDQTNKAKAVLENTRRQELGVTEAVWIHSHAGKVPRPEHVRWGRERKRYDLAKGMWSEVDQEWVFPGTPINCFPGDSQVQFADRVRVAYRRWYSGEVTELVTDSGKAVRATQNHPVLTPQGWVAVKSLQEGDYVWQVPDEGICSSEFASSSSSSRREFNVDQRVPAISEVFGALDAARKLRVIKKTFSEDFHGDAVADGDVDVVFAARPLTFGGELVRLQGCQEFALPSTDDPRLRASFRKQLGFSGLASAARSIGSAREAFALRLGSATHAHEHGVAATSHGAAGELDPGDYCTSGNTVLSRQREHGYTGFVLPAKLARLVRVVRMKFEGHVYNLETASGWYIAGAIIAHNCRCISRPIIPEEMERASERTAVRRGTSPRVQPSP